MKVYYVPNKFVKKYGFDELSPMTLANVQEVKKPQEADAVVFPTPLREHTPPVLKPEVLAQMIKDLGVDERRCVLFDCSDDEWSTSLNPYGLYIRCNLKPWMKQQMPRSIAWFWPVESLAQCVDLPEGGFKYDVSARMWITSSNVRLNSCNALRETPGLAIDIETYPDFYGYIENTDEGKRRRREFLRSMKESKVGFCPTSINNVFPYRYWEAMSAGRVAALIGDGMQFPWADRIPYRNWTISIPVEECHNAGHIVKGWLNSHTDKEIKDLGLEARHYWEKWLNRDKQSELWTVAVEEALKRDGLLK